MSRLEFLDRPQRARAEEIGLVARRARTAQSYREGVGVEKLLDGQHILATIPQLKILIDRCTRIRFSKTNGCQNRCEHQNDY